MFFQLDLQNVISNICIIFIADSKEKQRYNHITPDMRLPGTCCPKRQTSGWEMNCTQSSVLSSLPPPGKSLTPSCQDSWNHFCSLCSFVSSSCLKNDFLSMALFNDITHFLFRFAKLVTLKDNVTNNDSGSIYRPTE